ncbi:MAG: hypothetical protein KGJ05_01645, partial [Alphaproteobacteria bacterium]|nr:hypothetical protein [Alphaproteobacteria bacterium]
TPHVSYTLPHDRATITLGWINLWDEHGADRNGWSARADVNVTQKLMLFGGGANYPDTEAGITYRFSSRFLGGNYTISRKVTLMFGYETERNQLGVRRNGGWLGLRWALSAHSR